MSKVAITDAVRPNEDVMFRNLEGEAVLVHLSSGTYFGLDAVGTRIWEAIENHNGSLQAALDGVLADFEVERPEAEADLLALVQELVEAKLVVRA